MKMITDINNYNNVSDKDMSVNMINNNTNKNYKMLNLLFKLVAMWLLDEKEDINFSGSEDEIKALSRVMLASKDLYKYLRDSEECDPDILSTLLKRKNHFAKIFKLNFNADWPF